MAEIRLILTATAKGSDASVVALGHSGTGLGVIPQAAIASLLDARGQIVAMMNGAPRMSSSDLVKLGDAMGMILFGADVRATWSHASSNSPLVTEIVATTQELKAIPWEYVAFPDNKGPHRQYTVVRLVPQAKVKPFEAVDTRQGLRVLLLSASPLSFDHISWPDIRDKLVLVFQTALRGLEVVSDAQAPTSTKYLRIVDAADPTGVARAIADVNPHVVHFVGHGTDRGIALIDSKSAKKSVLLDAPGFSAALGAAPAVRLVILSACDVANPNTINPVDETVGTFAEQLVRHGVPAVVASQMVIDQRTVATFCEGLYPELLKSGSVDQAVAAGRCQVMAQLGTVQSAAIEWGIPVLYRSLGASQLFVQAQP